MADQPPKGEADKSAPADKTDDIAKDKAKQPTPEEEIERRAEEKAQVKITAEREKDRRKAEKDKADAEEEAAKEQGKWKELHAAAEARAVAAELRERREQLKGRLRDHVAASHPEYAVAAAKDGNPPVFYIWAGVQDQVAADTTDADADKMFKSAAEQYVKDNPRAAKGGGGAPAAPSGGRLPAQKQPNGQPTNQPMTTGMSRFY